MVQINGQKFNWKKVYEELYIKKKFSLRLIALEYNVSKVTVYNNFRKLNLKRRTVSEAIKFVDFNLEKHPNWKGGLHLDKGNGRILRCMGKGKYIQESVYQYLKQHNLDKIPKDYVVHHIDFNKVNNIISNLVLMKRSAHTTLHNKGGVKNERANN